MATFETDYKTEVEKMGEDNLLSGFGGVILGGLAGYALSNWNKGPMPYGAGFGSFGGYTQADVQNIIATKDADYNQLNATQQGEFNTINRIDTLGVNLATGLASLGYENARLANANQIQTMQSTGAVQNAVAEASAKADLCCCKTQGMISNIVPEIKNFYLQDEVSKLRDVIGQQQVACGFGKVNDELKDIDGGIKAILYRLYNPPTP